jgi:pimeloyl-ACP methyl ester carboxylesterase
MNEARDTTAERGDGFVHATRDVGEVKLHVVEARPRGATAQTPPADVPLVVLCHGFPEFWWTWRRQLRALAGAGLWAVAPDMRGYGESDKPARVDAYDIDALAGDVAGLIRALGRERAIVVGHDWGGAVAWRFAELYPEMLDRLAILNVPHPRVMLSHIWRPRQARKSWYIFFFQLGRLAERAAAKDDFAAIRKMFAVDGVAPDEIERYVEALRTPGALRAGMSYYRAVARRVLTGNAPRPRRIDAPVLVIWGDRDRALGKEMAEPPPRLVPNARVVHIEHAPHWVQNAAPDEVNALLLDFIAPRDARSRADERTP